MLAALPGVGGWYERVGREPQRRRAVRRAVASQRAVPRPSVPPRAARAQGAAGSARGGWRGGDSQGRSVGRGALQPTPRALFSGVAASGSCGRVRPYAVARTPLGCRVCAPAGQGRLPTDSHGTSGITHQRCGGRYARRTRERGTWRRCAWRRVASGRSASASWAIRTMRTTRCWSRRMPSRPPTRPPAPSWAASHTQAPTRTRTAQNLA